MARFAQATQRTGAAWAAFFLLTVALWLRWPAFGFSLWNVDEAIHAAAARVILEGGVLYRDAIDQRTPLSYYVVAGVFALFGENNLWAVRCFVALLIAATGWLLFLAARRIAPVAAGVAAGTLYVLLASATLFQGDANAANSEWFVAFFSSACVLVFLSGGSIPSHGRLFAAGLLSGCSFLSKQPALLDSAGPLAALLYANWRTGPPSRALVLQLGWFAAGLLTPVLLSIAWFAAHGALADALFYAWHYNLSYYGPEISTADRVGSLAAPFRLIGSSQPWLLALWLGGAVVILHRLLQRVPTATESTTNASRLLVAVWSLAGLAGAASGGRAFDHYSIQFLAPFCLGAGLVLGSLAAGAWTAFSPRGLRLAAAVLLALVGWQAVSAAIAARGRTLPEDPSRRVSAYIREHSAAGDRVFVWGFHPDIYLHADRLPASRFLYASFLTGLIPWTNVAANRDTAYAVVPGAMETLLRELSARPPLYIVDCSAGPNRFWQKYPTEIFPAFHRFIRERYRQEQSHQFVPQGFRLYRLRSPNEAGENPEPGALPATVTATLRLGTVSAPLTPIRATAPHGASLNVMDDGRMEYFAHAPSSLVYRVPAQASAIRGGFGFRPGAFAPDNRGPTDGVEFTIRWRPDGSSEQILFRRLLQPREKTEDRGIHSFRVSLPPHSGGELELVTGTGPFENSASDWSFWSDLVLENYH